MNLKFGSNAFVFKAKEISKNLWFRCLLYCLFSLTAFLLGSLTEPYLPEGVNKIVTRESVANILTILATSMLAVSTFSLSTMIQANATAATTATPRASTLIMENNTAQNALGTFIGAFLFSIVGLIGISANYYDNGIVFLLFMFTIVMILLIIIMLLKWIHQLSRLGRVSEIIGLTDKELENSIKLRACHPTLYANELNTNSMPSTKGLSPISCDKVGYIQYIDMEKINELACKHDVKIYILKLPGAFLDGVSPFAYISAGSDESLNIKLINALVIGEDRTFSQDPRYGFIILSEIGLRALSPSVNDAGTVIDVIGSYVRAIVIWNKSFYGKDKSEKTKVKYKNVYIEKIQEEEIFDDMFSSLMPQASQHVAVAIRLKKSILSMLRLNTPELSKNCLSRLAYFDKLCEQNLNEQEFSRVSAIKPQTAPKQTEISEEISEGDSH